MRTPLVNQIDSAIYTLAQAGTPTLDYESEFLAKVLSRAIGMMAMSQLRDLLAYVYDEAFNGVGDELAELACIDGFPESCKLEISRLLEEARQKAGGLPAVPVAEIEGLQP